MTAKEMKKAKDAMKEALGNYTRIAKDPAASKQDLKKACDAAISQMWEFNNQMDKRIDELEKRIEDLTSWR